MKARVMLVAEVDVEITDPEIIQRIKNICLMPVPEGSTDESLNADVDAVDQAMIAAAARQPTVEWEIEDWSAVCRVCGCTDDEGCVGGCEWVEVDLCSRCVEYT